MRIGIDLGERKSKHRAADDGSTLSGGRRLARLRRVDEAVAGLVEAIEGATKHAAAGVGILERHAGRPRQERQLDLADRTFARSHLEIRLSCAVRQRTTQPFRDSEAADGAGAGADARFASALGTELVVVPRVRPSLDGPNSITGDDTIRCRGCHQMSIPGRQRQQERGCIDFPARDSSRLRGAYGKLVYPAIVAAGERGETDAISALARYRDRLRGRL